MGDLGRYKPIDTTGFSPALRNRTYDGKAVIAWALSYNGYKRLGAGSSELVAVLRPLMEDISTSGRVPEWAGVDLLRGLAFWLVRVAAHHEAPEDALDDDQFLAVVDALHRHRDARPKDRPPL